MYVCIQSMCQHATLISTRVSLDIDARSHIDLISSIYQDFLLTDQSNLKQSKHYSHRQGVVLTSDAHVNGISSTDFQKCVPSRNVFASMKVTNLAAAWNCRSGSGEQDSKICACDTIDVHSCGSRKCILVILLNGIVQ